MFELVYIKVLRFLVEGVKVNDVMLIIIGGGLYKYLLYYDDFLKMIMIVMVLILVWIEGEKNMMGN